MNVYVATSFKNIPEARVIMDTLEGVGHRVTHDWTQMHCDPAWSKKRQATYLRICGAQDYHGVRKADALVLINHPECRDALVEFGLAAGQGKPVIVLYPERRPGVFFSQHWVSPAGSVSEMLDLLTDAELRGIPAEVA